MEDGRLLTGLIEAVQTHPGLILALAFGFALLESLAIVGIFVPGIVLLFLVGAVVGMDPGLFLAAWAAASAGALLGDTVSHWLGYRYSDRIPRLWPLSRRPDMMAAAQVLFARHGGKGVFIGRFIGPIRPVVPLLAGSMGMRPLAFLTWALPASILWAPLYLLPGMVFGASLELAADFAGRLVIVLMIIVLGGWFVAWVTRLIYEYTARRSGWWLRGMIRWSTEQPKIGRLLRPLFEPGGREVLSVALLGMLLVISLAVLIAVLVSTPFLAPAWDAEYRLSGLAASLRNHVADPLFAWLSLVAETPVALTIALLMGLVLAAIGRWMTLAHWLSATLGAYLLSLLLSLLTGLISEAPVGLTVGQVPHRGMALTATVFGFFAVMLAKDLSARRRKWPYLFSSVLVGLFAFAHFYLGLASVAGLLAAVALAMGWTALVGIAYRQRSRVRRRPTWLALVFYLSIPVVALVQGGNELDARLDATRLAQPDRSYPFLHWQDEGWQELPDRLSRLGRYPRTRFDFQLAANLDLVADHLSARGWRRVEASSAAALMALILGPAEDASLPHSSRDFAGRPDDLVMRYQATDGSVYLVRLWSSGARLEPGAVPVWLGQVRKVEQVRQVAVFHRWYEVDLASGEALRRLDEDLQDWRISGQQAPPRLYVSMFD